MSPTPFASQPAVSVTPKELDFGFDLVRTLMERNAGQNVLVSPIGIAQILAILQNGAGGKTRNEIASVLGVGATDLEGLNRRFRKFLDSVQTDGPVVVNLANSLWVAELAGIKPKFLDVVERTYSSEVCNVDFASPGTLDRINRWVADRTRGKITSVLTDFDHSVEMLAVSAVYFKGMWASSFDAKWTRERQFCLVDGTTKLHPLMAAIGSFEYCEGPDFQAVRLPYRDHRMSMYVILPRRTVQSLSDLLSPEPKCSDLVEKFFAQMNGANWNQLMHAFEFRKVHLELPRFRIACSFDLKPPLQDMGLRVPFDENAADFSGVSTRSLFLGRASHKSLIDVNEEGTEAAAATVMLDYFGMEPDRLRMIVDHPFCVAIRDENSQELLFVGAILDPSQDQH